MISVASMYYIHVNTCLQSKEARRLKEFLEDYDDENDDPKYYK